MGLHSDGPMGLNSENLNEPGIDSPESAENSTAVQKP